MQDQHPLLAANVVPTSFKAGQAGCFSQECLKEKWVLVSKLSYSPTPKWTTWKSFFIFERVKPSMNLRIRISRYPPILWRGFQVVHCCGPHWLPFFPAANFFGSKEIQSGKLAPCFSDKISSILNCLKNSINHQLPIAMVIGFKNQWLFDSKHNFCRCWWSEIPNNHLGWC